MIPNMIMFTIEFSPKFSLLMMGFANPNAKEGVTYRHVIVK